MLRSVGAYGDTPLIFLSLFWRNACQMGFSMINQVPSQKLKSQADNIFEIENPEAYSCFIEKYSAGGARLRITAYKGHFEPERAISLFFSGVCYFEGPIVWQGANFTVGEPSEALELMRKVGWPEDTATNQIDISSTGLHLFKVKLPKCEVRIIAANAHWATTADEADPDI
jgi:hypothetical protein